MASDLSSLAAAFHSLRAAGEDFVLATIVATEGSTYRKAGARMILARSGACYGLLGGGSFEDDLRQAAQPSFSGGCHLSLSCEMPSPRDADPEGRWQRDGVARILLQYHSPDDGCRAMSLIAGALESRSTRVLVTITDSARADLPMGTSILSGSTLQDELAADLADEITATAAAVLASGPTMLVRHAVAGGEIEVFYAQIHPPLHLLIVGAGPDAEPLARLAGVLGWQITVVDARPAFCRADRFPDAIEVCAMGAAEFPVRLNPDHFDAAVLMTRNYELDQDFLERIALTPIPFIGLLGSKARCARLLEETGDTAARRLAGRVRGPVGLDIQAQTPEEIALAIVAQVQASWDRARRDRRATSVIAPPPGEPAARDRVYAILLAAGGSKRFGGFKQLLEFRGESLLRRSVALAGAVLPGRVIVVHGPKPMKCRRELAGCNVIHVNNENWESGMASSLKAGIRALPGDCEAVLVLLCDQPMIRAEQLESMIDMWARGPEKIIAGTYAGVVGVPAVIPRKYFPDILKLAGDRGAKSVLTAHAAETIPYALPEAELDIDTQEDFAKLLRRN